jgi:hypothetical protein
MNTVLEESLKVVTFAFRQVTQRFENVTHFTGFLQCNHRISQRGYEKSTPANQIAIKG